MRLMFHRSVLLLALALACAWSANPPALRSDENATAPPPAQALAEVMKQYSAASGKLTREGRTEFFTHWEQQFRTALVSSTMPSAMRLQMLGELGAIQRELRKPGDAMETWEVMISEAWGLDDLHSVVRGLSSEFAIAKSGPDKRERDKIGERYIAAAAFRARKLDSEVATNEYANALIDVAMTLNRSVADPNLNGDRAKSLQRAIEMLTTSLGLKHGGVNPTATKLYWLADTYSKAGQKELAAETYGRIASMNQKEFSPLWMRQLQVEQLHKAGTPEYCKALATVLYDFIRSGKADAHEVNLCHLLGKSYRACGEYEKSSQVLRSIAGKSKDDQMNAYNLYLTGDNELKLGHVDAAVQLLQEVITKYPESGSASIAKTELKRIESMP